MPVTALGSENEKAENFTIIRLRIIETPIILLTRGGLRDSGRLTFMTSRENGFQKGKRNILESLTREAVRGNGISCLETGLAAVCVTVASLRSQDGVGRGVSF